MMRGAMPSARSKSNSVILKSVSEALEKLAAWTGATARAATAAIRALRRAMVSPPQGCRLGMLRLFSFGRGPLGVRASRLENYSRSGAMCTPSG